MALGILLAIIGLWVIINTINGNLIDVLGIGGQSTKKISFI